MKSLLLTYDYVYDVRLMIGYICWNWHGNRVVENSKFPRFLLFKIMLFRKSKQACKGEIRLDWSFSYVIRYFLMRNGSSGGRTPKKKIEQLRHNNTAAVKNVSDDCRPVLLHKHSNATITKRTVTRFYRNIHRSESSWEIRVASCSHSNEMNSLRQKLLSKSWPKLQI